ncbi:MAG: hypothetical protein MJY73_02280 [Bacteroidales bacterium]|nr:hypothetical protein [Bacteroidales bacterium]
MAEEFENINEQPDVQEPKETLNDKVDELKEKVDDLKDKVDDLKEKVEEKAEAFGDKVEEKAEAFKEKAEEAYEKVKADIDDVTAEIDPEDIKKNKIYAVLAYVGILVVIPIFFAKESKFAKFHANQGLILFLIELVVGLFLKKWILGIIEAVVFVFAVMGIVYAIQGKAKELPVIGNFKILK